MFNKMCKKVGITCTFNQSLKYWVWGYSLFKWLVSCHKYVSKNKQKQKSKCYSRVCGKNVSINLTEEKGEEK